MNIYESAMTRAKYVFKRAMDKANSLIEKYPNEEEYRYSYFDSVNAITGPQVETMLKYGILTRRKKRLPIKSPPLNISMFLRMVLSSRSPIV